jgi:hypothetical protein
MGQNDEQAVTRSLPQGAEVVSWSFLRRRRGMTTQIRR